MIALGPVTPVLRIFDEHKAREFYVDFLEFKVVFEHRFADNFPLYMSVMRDACTLHLSEHHGDACPGAYVRIQSSDVASLVQILAAKQYTYAKPSVERTPWQTLETTITDPFGNKLVFVENEEP